MGCVCVKGVSPNEKAEIKGDKGTSLLSKQAVASCKKDADNTTRLIKGAEETAVSSPKINPDDGKKKMSTPSAVNVPALSRKGSVLQKMVGIDNVDPSGIEHKPKIIEVPDGFKGEQVAAGWPSWLASVAGEAIKGWVPRKADSFEKLDKIGQGTYSNVYKARDLETGKIVALKKVRFVNMDPESVRFMAREVYVLRRLDHPNIVKLEGLVASKVSRSLYLVFEYMEHDLAGLSATPSIKFSESQIKCYMKQLLCGLEHCHGRGVLHRDIKGSNLLIDNDGILRIADFGLATFFSPNKKQSLTSRVVTLWYRPPELLLGATEYGIAVDLWSSGCILAELLGGKPIMPGRTEVEQLHKIFKLCGSPSEEYWRNSKLPHATIFKPQHPYARRVCETFKDFPASALALLDVLLAIEPQNRGTAKSALESEFFKTKPYACDPSSLPKYPPSKEFDAKLREEAARRERSSRRCSREQREVVNGTTKMERRSAKLNHKSSSQKYTEGSASGFPLDPPRRGLTRNNTSWSKKARDDEHETVASQSLSARRGLHVVDLKTQRSYTQRISTNSGNLSGPLALVKPEGWERRTKPALQEQRSRRGQRDVVEASKKPELTHLHKPVYSHKKEERVEVKDSAALDYGTKKSRILYSGPLMPSGGNMDEMLKEHERQIQHAVRRARVQRGLTEEPQLRVT